MHMTLAQSRAQVLLDFASAATEFKTAFALAPGSPRVVGAFADFESLLGHHDSAIYYARRSISLDPLKASNYEALAAIYLDAGRYPEALTTLKHARTLNPRSYYAEELTTEILLASGENEAAKQRCESPQTSIENLSRQVCLIIAYHRLGPGC
jgi:tetratricopeptide (TPR) repeat protein